MMVRIRFEVLVSAFYGCLFIYFACFTLDTQLCLKVVSTVELSERSSCLNRRVVRTVELSDERVV